MGVDIEEVIMVLDHDSVDEKDRMVVLVFVNPDMPLPAQQLVRFTLVSEQPDIDSPHCRCPGRG